MKVCALTQRGSHKEENEDRIVVGKEVVSNGGFCGKFKEGVFAVADGVGGRNAGAVASGFVAKELSKVDCVDEDTLLSINEALLAESFRSRSREGMATTLSGVFIRKGSALIFSIGNSRVYAFQRGKYLKQLTTDDTTLNYLISTGKLSAKDAESFDRKNEITACFGGGDPDFFEVEISTAEGLRYPFVITTDGVHDFLDVDDIERILASNGISEHSCSLIVAAARENGSEDDASVILIET